MGKHQKVWARQARLRLLEELGGRCTAADCPVPGGETDFEKLTFDHIHGKDWSARGKSADQRILRHRKEAKEPAVWCDSCQRVHGKLQILCQVCNSRKGEPLDGEEEERFAMLCVENGFGLTKGSADDEPF